MRISRTAGACELWPHASVIRLLVPPPSAYLAAFAQLDEADAKDVARFIRRFDALAGSEFMKHPIGLNGELLPGVSPTGDPAWNVSVRLPPEESVKPIIGDFRMLYTDTNQCSAMRVLRILSRSASARGTSEGRDAIEALRDIRQQLQERRKSDPAGKILETSQDGSLVERPPKDIIDVWFNGEYFHDDRELAEQLLPAGSMNVEMLRMTLHNAIRDYVRIWRAIRNTADGLLDALAEQTSPGGFDGRS
jgi:hypothetical protein